MKNIIKKVPGFYFINNIRKVLNNRYLLVSNYVYDYNKFSRFISLETSGYLDNKSIESWILQDKHRLEKGLSLPTPRPGFGELVVKRLSKNLKLQASIDNCSDVYFIGLGALRAYKEFHESNGLNLPDFFLVAIENFSEKDFFNPLCDKVGVSSHTENTSEDENIEFFKKFSSSRHSCRNFDKNRTIDKFKLNEIIKLAISAPSVCNRQHWKVHIFEGESKDKILKLQNGNTGFSDNIPYIAVVTSDIRSFYHPNERNQPFVDGGMFSMNFIYALHSYGISSCALNWCVSSQVDKTFHKYGYIKDNENIIMYIAFGYPELSGVYAKSPRLPVNYFIEKH
ncbi:hypothetical protein CSB62_22155 [Vibrio splendidus]|uniref:Nitroreductase domain-containing protein n=1 Tax=Vibrio lentus TaxID=136468 RepID=A0A4U2BCT5_9VIBR|nr:nitroreductase family protein [Vibrio lentus]PHN83907.1 hypothetical protein CSB62_22155 [Vibrio splendidus]MCC4781987.1 nitroreductase family protein [Vibrio lentus]MCC4858709.1 nitroreductase family protein [Vibrio lentus]OMO27927.1 hypothetical protein BH583_04510 [Vibrio lentus]PMI94474.1 hypothetical protein BCU33_17955 [Vibrio lentus]